MTFNIIMENKRIKIYLIKKFIKLKVKINKLRNILILLKMMIKMNKISTKN